MKKEKVAIVRCRSYKQKEVNLAVRKILDLLEFPADKYKKVLIKPNVVGLFDKNQEAIITHPSIVRAIKKTFADADVGESSFMNTEAALNKLGYKEFKPIVFEKNKIVKIRDKKAKILKEFYLPESVKRADLIINVPKMKTHTLAKMTGAIKNLYGCIPGGEKQVFHARARGDEEFSKLLVDIYQNIFPELNILDAVIAMEGEGPTSGKQRKVNLILASRSAIALDIAMAKIMGYHPSEILAIREAERRFGKINIEIIGDLKKIRNLHFKKPLNYKKKQAKKMLDQLVEEKIVCNTQICTRCAKCFAHCPMKAISMKPFPEVDVKKCIRCFCCIEICPTNAMHLGDKFNK
jgi:uncharacterized protein (DUF362 family)